MSDCSASHLQLKTRLVQQLASQLDVESTSRTTRHTPRLFLRANVFDLLVAVEVVDSGLAEHGVVLELTLAERRSVTSNDLRRSN